MSVAKSNLAQRALGFLVLIALMAGSVIPAFGQTRRTRRRTPRLGRYTRPVANTTTPAYYTVNAGQTIRVRMNEEISSGNARVGDRFTTTVVDPVYSAGIEVIPSGSIIGGRVTSVDRASRKSKAGTIGVSFVSVQLPNGSSRAINGSLTNLAENAGGNSDNEGQVSGRSSMKRNVVFIGGGAATGALIGAIAGGGKGAGIGAGVGAGLGVAGAIFSKGQEAVVKRDTEFGVVLNQSVSLPASNVR
ncbi:MAG TPA: hypothetical protein VF723_14055 [Pyrinomonadaceae bacterium]